MSGINKVFLIGYLGEDPELKMLTDNTALTTFRFATHEIINKHDKTEHTEWHTIVMWRSLAEVAAKLLKKNKLIYIEGKIHTRSFEDKEGRKRYTTEIFAENFKLLGRRSDYEEVVALINR